MNGKREAKNRFFLNGQVGRWMNEWWSESAAKQRQKYLRAVIMNEWFLQYGHLQLLKAHITVDCNDQ